MKYLLSCAGGGIRGLLQAKCLVKLEALTGKLTRDIFQFVAGTSTGALITAAVAAGVPAASILEVYRHRTAEIFSPSNTVENEALLVARGHRYEIATANRVVRSILGEYADKSLNDLPIDVMIAAVSLTNGHPWFFVRDNPGNAQTTGKLKLADCATASAAAPTYFDSYTMPDGSKFVDGGVGVAGNPVYQACVEAFEFSAGNYDLAQTVVVNLGTGRPPDLSAPSGSLLSTLEWVIGVLVDAPEDQQIEMVERLYQPRLAGFWHFDVSIPRIRMDDVSALPALEEYGDKMAADVDWEKILAA